jgi:hypothetical protein
MSINAGCCQGVPKKHVPENSLKFFVTGVHVICKTVSLALFSTIAIQTTQMTALLYSGFDFIQ